MARRQRCTVVSAEVYGSVRAADGRATGTFYSLGMATPLVRSIARAALARGNVVRAISTSNCLSASKADDIMEKWPAEMLITEFDKHFIDYFNRPEIDALTELHDYDVIPDPK
ncbi:hypothetical protein ANCDUO_11102, partial [Ancylostoma duodenale]